MTDYAQYPTEVLITVGGNLNDISDTLSSSSKGAYEILGFSADQSPINDALGDFKSEWDASVKKLGENIGDFGDLSKQIGQMAADTDQALADAMHPGTTSGATGGATRAV
jgi:hypothetical protein